MRKPVALVSFVAGLAIAFAPGAGAGDPPEAISYQGVLRDTSGNPVVDDVYAMEFHVFDEEATGIGNDLLCDSQPVAVTDGLFTVRIGDPANVAACTGAGNAVSLSSVLAQDGPLFLEVRVRGDVLSPRVTLASAGYALNARRVRGVDVVTGFDEDLYVDASSGDDGADGRTPATAKRTIQAAIDSIPLILAHHVTVHIADGVYPEHIEIDRLRSGLPYTENGIELTLEGNPVDPYAVTLNGNGTIDVGIRVTGAIVRMTGIRVFGFTRYGMEIAPDVTVLVEDSRIEGNGGGNDGAGARVESLLILSRTVVDSNDPVGVAVDGGGKLEAEFSEFSGASDDGVRVSFGEANLSECTFETNADSGLAVDRLGAANTNALTFTNYRNGIRAVDNSLVRLSGANTFSGSLGWDIDVRRHSTVSGYPATATCTSDAHSICDPAAP